jgi:hypothetical protein
MSSQKGWIDIARHIIDSWKRICTLVSGVTSHSISYDVASKSVHPYRHRCRLDADGAKLLVVAAQVETESNV